jgi:hypothetical protein
VLFIAALGFARKDCITLIIAVYGQICDFGLARLKVMSR